MASVAIAVGASIASSWISSLLTPPVQDQNRLDDLSVLKSEYGVAIPKPYGRCRVTGNITWGTDIEERRTVQGGKGGGGREQYQYYGNFQSLLAFEEVVAFGRIWFNNKLVYDGESSGETLSASNKYKNKYLEFYLGSNTQLRDSLIESVEGEPETPAFRNFVYLIGDGVPLEDWGRAIPKVEVELIANPAPYFLNQVIEDVCLKAGLEPAEINIEPTLNGIEVKGAIWNQNNTSPGSFLQDLQKIFHFLIIDEGDRVTFKSIQRPPEEAVIDIPDEVLATREAGSEPIHRFSEREEQDLDLPSSVQIEYANFDNAYKRGHQLVYKSRANHVNESNFRTSVVLTDSEAATAARRYLEYLWLQRYVYDQIFLPFDYFTLEVADLVRLNIRGESRVLQVSKLTKGSNFIAEIELTRYDGEVGDLEEILISNYEPPSTLFDPGDPTALIFDIPLLNDNDAEFGVYSSVQPDGTWRGGDLFVNPASTTYTPLVSIPDNIPQGTLVNLVPNGEPFIVDEDTVITVNLTSGTIESIPDYNFANFEALLLINGEIIAFQNAVLTGGNTYEISNLVRGVKGTEHNINLHPANDNVYVIRGGVESNVIDAPGDFIFLNQSVTFKAIPTGDAETDVTNETAITFANNRAKPYSPVNPLLGRYSNEDLLLTWNRRVRKYGGGAFTSLPLPLGEESELYDVEILDGMSVVRTYSGLTSPQLFYPLVDQTTDFGAGQTSLSFRVYQISATVGRGFPLVADIVYSYTL